MATSSLPESSAANSSVSGPIVLACEFNRHRREWCGEFGEARDVLAGYGLAIEEIARVVQLQPIRDRPSECLEHQRYLQRQRAGRRRAVECPAPQVAE